MIATLGLAPAAPARATVPLAELTMTAAVAAVTAASVAVTPNTRFVRLDMENALLAHTQAWHT